MSPGGARPAVGINEPARQGNRIYPQLRSLKLEVPNHDSDDENLSKTRNKEDE